MSENNLKLVLSGKDLAPILDNKLREELPKELFKKKPLIFIIKLIICYGIVTACYWIIFSSFSKIFTFLSILILGFIYAHMIELQHECLHEGAFKNRRLNRFFGFLLGNFMLSSYTHYKYEHLLHHSYLGTPLNREFFNYRFNNINNIPGFIVAACHLGRYTDVLKNIFNSFTSKKIEGIDSKKWELKIKREYILMTFILISTIIYSIFFKTYFWILSWYFPVLFISESVHFFIELPEHYGLNTLNAPNVLENTRTVKTSVFWQWFTNGNNLHTAHHYHHGVPMCNIDKLHEITKNKITVWENSYWDFYKKVIRGEISYNPNENCMKR